MHLECIHIDTKPLSGDPFSQGIPNHLFESNHLRPWIPNIRTFSDRSNSKVGVLKLFFFPFGVEVGPSFWKKTACPSWRKVSHQACQWTIEIYGMIMTILPTPGFWSVRFVLEPTEERIIPNKPPFCSSWLPARSSFRIFQKDMPGYITQFQRGCFNPTGSIWYIP